MKRSIEKTLIAWKHSSSRLPLLLSGPRQVGKSYLVENFGKHYFEQTLTINFEEQPDLKKLFHDFNIERILNNLAAIFNTKIDPNTTLLFLDEIQECPEAIQAMRYFKERKPELAVIGAASLLGSVFNDSEFSFPVDRVQFFYLKPLSFLEFLDASKESGLIDWLAHININEVVPEPIHHKFLQLWQLYQSLGGMPAVIDTYLKTQDLTQCQKLQTTIATTYRRDFGKYSRFSQHKHLEAIFEKIPQLVGQWFKYVNINPEWQARDIKHALNKLIQAGLITPAYACQPSWPLTANINLRKFKLLFLDIGLMLRAEKTLLSEQGDIFEQTVGQELLAYQAYDEAAQLFFWHREQKSSSAEVDYLLPIPELGQILPIEVKSGNARGKIKSLQIYMQEFKQPIGIRIWMKNIEFSNNILSIPPYLISKLPKIIASLSKTA